MGDLGQIVQLRFDVRNDEQLDSCVKHADTVINLIGRNYPSLNFTLQQTHVDIARKLAKLSRERGVSKFVHISALGADVNSPSEFLKTKALGEIAVREEFPDAIIIRPSSVYGYEDRFWTRIGFYVRFGFLGMPVYNNGETITRPVYVGDVAKVISKMVEDDSAIGKTVELYGPYKYKQQRLVDLFLDVSKRDAFVWYPSKFVAKRIADALNMVLPFVQISRDEIERAYIDEVPSKKDSGVLTFEDLGIKPVSVEDSAYSFLSLYTPASLQRHQVNKGLKLYREAQ
ncbi:hypothetical protein HDU84_001744 [Entophlyctis sp. JEL0112]|nr:hypothetical protein HDU84_001744 [Entophlyctis sp. JEL0112]